jgi:hypothetical protein
MQVERRAGGARPRHLLDQDRTVQEVAAQAAVGLGDVAAQKAELARLVPERTRHLPLLLPLRVKGRDVLGNEAPHRVAEQVVVGAEQGPRDHGVARRRSARVSENLPASINL